MKRAFAYAIVVLVLAVPALGCSPDPLDIDDDAQVVNVNDDNFSPSSLTTRIGDPVDWRWRGSHDHNVTWVEVNSSVPNSLTQRSGAYRRVFTQNGTFNYYCTVHGTPTSGMRGSVTVQ